MSTKLLVTLTSPDERETVLASGAELLADYPDSLLVRATDDQQQALANAGLELAPLADPVIQTSGLTFDFAATLEANESAPIDIDPNRTNYYLVQLVGPVQAVMLDGIRAQGGVIHARLSGFTLLVGLLQANVDAVAALPYVEGISLYRPSMKVSPHLRQDEGRDLDAAGLSALEFDDARGDESEQIEIGVFPGESTAAVAAKVRESGGVVLSEGEQAVKAVVSRSTIPELAAEVGVQSILPHRFPEFHNNVASGIMDVPANRVFGDLELSGAGQIIAVADSGLDSGNVATIHADFAGRVAGLVSLPVRPQLNAFITSPPGADNGPQDAVSGHGTHVAGSVLGNGAAAVAVGDPTVPQGIAPEAQLFFQAIEQEVTWKTATQLNNEGISVPPNWPPPESSLWGLPDNLNDLFTVAYVAGARIHTNSWGAPVSGVYNDSSREVDQFMWNNRDMLILFSAGNEGLDINGDGVIDVDSIGSPGTAKNCLTVGASENNRPAGSAPAPGLNGNWSALILPNGNLKWPALVAAGHVSDNVEGMAAFSSRGPTDDARIKPDVVAPGTNILSVRSSVVGTVPPPLWGDVIPAAHALNGLYCWSGGTSMSTPLVAGAAGLIRQHLVQHRGQFQANVKPSGALIKAFLINGAEAMTGQFAGEIPAAPNNVSGFGRVSLEQSLIPGVLGQTLFADEPGYAVESGEIRTFEVQAVDLSQPIKVTLVWTDAPGLINVGNLQNTLYLQVVEPGGGILNGDTTAFPTVSNNVQQVTVAAPVIGTYQIRVRGVSVSQQAPGAAVGVNPRQDFAVAASNVMGMSLQAVSIAQAIDTTGSMGFYGYMEPAKERAAQLFDFMRINDKVSITEFSRRFGAPADARTPYPLRLLGNFTPDWSDAHTAIDALVSDGMTPIGAGLQEAWNQLVAEPAARPRAIVLLSDGFNNIAPDPLTVLPAIPNDVPIFTVALGPASNAATLSAIAGSRPNGGYFSVESDEDIHKLHQIYAQIQALAAGAALVGLQSAEVESQAEDAHEMNVEDEVDEATFALSWDARNEVERIRFQVIDPDGNLRTVNATPATAERLGKAHHIVRVAAPTAGVWTLLVANPGSQLPVKYTVSGAVQSNLVLSLDTVKIGGERLFLEARLRRGRKPWDDARLFARITRPTRSRQDILDQFGDEIKQIDLPDELLEDNLSDEQLLALKLSVFAQNFRNERGGLYRRETIQVEMIPRGDGAWTAELTPIALVGNVDVVILAEGDIDGLHWQRHAAQAIQGVAETTAQPEPAFTITDILARRNRLWGYTIIGVRVAKANGDPATAADGIAVGAKLATADEQLVVDNLPYYSPGRYFIWRVRTGNFGEVMAQINASVSSNGAIIAQAEEGMMIR